MRAPLLRLEAVSKRFSGLLALDRVSVSFFPGEVVGLIGPNGAGKTTLVNTVTGVVRPSSGRVIFDRENIEGLRPDQIARRGVARTFQVVQPFPRLTVRQNVAAAALFAGGAANAAEANRLAEECLALCHLEQVAGQGAGTLTLASRKRLELAKSLASRPKLLMLDEVNAGLNAAEVDLALDLIQRIAARGITIVLIEHLMKVVSKSCSRLVVLHQGKVIAEGPTTDVMRNEDVIEAYLGKRYAALQQGAFI